MNFHKLFKYFKQRKRCSSSKNIEDDEPRLIKVKQKKQMKILKLLFQIMLLE